MKNILSVSNLSYFYQDGDTIRYNLKDITFDFEKGKFYTILGESGSGKTTLLSLIAALEEQKQGKIKYENIRFTDSDFPTGEFDIVASSNFTDNKEIRLNYKFNGSYIADVAIFYNKNDKEYRTVNLADNSIVKGKTSNIDNHIKSLAQKIIISKLIH